MTKTLAEITERLAAIEVEQAKLSQTDHDALLAKAIVSGSGVDQVEADQANAERLAKRLRIEHETLTDMLPAAKRADVMPEIERLIEQHAALMKTAGKTAAVAVELWEKLQVEIQTYGDVRAKAINLTNQARAIASEVKAPLPILGAPMSQSLNAISRPMERAGSQLQQTSASRAPLVSENNQFDYQGLDVDAA